MNRRAFLTKLGIGIVATAALAQVPASVIKRSEWLADSGRNWAQRKLLALYNDYSRKTGHGPKEIVVSPDFMALFESELQANQRFVDVEAMQQDHKALAFKATRVYQSGYLQGYTAVIAS